MAVKELDQGRVGLCGTPFERRVCAALWPLRMQGETRARAGEGGSRRLRARACARSRFNRASLARLLRAMVSSR